MISNPQILIKDGNKEFAVIPYEEYLKIQEMIENYEDLMDLREAEALEREAPTVSVDEVIASFNQ